MSRFAGSVTFTEVSALNLAQTDRRSDSDPYVRWENADTGAEEMEQMNLVVNDDTSFTLTIMDEEEASVLACTRSDESFICDPEIIESPLHKATDRRNSFGIDEVTIYLFTTLVCLCAHNPQCARELGCKLGLVCSGSYLRVAITTLVTNSIPF